MPLYLIASLIPLAFLLGCLLMWLWWKTKTLDVTITQTGMTTVVAHTEFKNRLQRWLKRRQRKGE